MDNGQQIADLLKQIIVNGGDHDFRTLKLVRDFNITLSPDGTSGDTIVLNIVGTFFDVFKASGELDLTYERQGGDRETILCRQGSKVANLSNTFERITLHNKTSNTNIVNIKAGLADYIETSASIIIESSQTLPVDIQANDGFNGIGDVVLGPNTETSIAGSAVRRSIKLTSHSSNPATNEIRIGGTASTNDTTGESLFTGSHIVIDANSAFKIRAVTGNIGNTRITIVETTQS